MRRFASAADAAKELHEHLNAWTTGLARYGLQCTFALIGGNWVLHSSQALLLADKWALRSLMAAIFYLSALLLLMGTMVALIWWRHRDADSNHDRWRSDFEAAGLKKSAFPYTPIIEMIGQGIQFLHVIGPAVSGFALLASVVGLSNKPIVPPGDPCLRASCCSPCVTADHPGIDRIGDELEKLRRGLSGTSVPPRSIDVPAVGVSTATTTDVIVPGRSDLSALAWPLGTVGVLLVVGGTAFFAASRKLRWKAAAASVVSVGALTMTAGGLAMIKELKIESLFTLKLDRLVDLVRTNVLREGGSSLERVGAVDRFAIGRADIVEEKDRADAVPLSRSQGMRDAVRTWIERRDAGRDGVLLIVGAADRLPLSGKLGGQFDANVGLAQARGEAVRVALIDLIRATRRDYVPDPNRIIVVVSGPSRTPDEMGSTGASKRGGYPEDRRVDVWSFWTSNSSNDGGKSPSR